MFIFISAMAISAMVRITSTPASKLSPALSIPLRPAHHSPPHSCQKVNHLLRVMASAPSITFLLPFLPWRIQLLQANPTSSVTRHQTHRIIAQAPVSYQPKICTQHFLSFHSQTYHQLQLISKLPLFT